INRAINLRDKQYATSVLDRVLNKYELGINGISILTGIKVIHNLDCTSMDFSFLHEQLIVAKRLITAVAAASKGIEKLITLCK
ncbi:MAG: hypothetical protein ACRC2T_18915, partial [Thermoguttaceae bacterium]